MSGHACPNNSTSLHDCYECYEVQLTTVGYMHHHLHVCFTIATAPGLCLVEKRDSSFTSAAIIWSGISRRGRSM
jgi:hypothetical protein